MKYKPLTTLQVANLTLQDVHRKVLELSRTEPQLTIALSDAAWLHLSGIKAFVGAVEPPSSSNDLRNGRLGKMLGLPLVTDAYSKKPIFPEGLSICRVLSA